MVFNLTVEKLQEKFPSVYEAVFSAGVASVKVEDKSEELKTELVTLLESAREQGQLETCVKLLSEGKSNQEILDGVKLAKEEALANFRASAAPPAGSAHGSEQDIEVSDHSSAVAFIMSRDGCSRGQASKKARREFPEVYGKLVNNSEKEGE